MMAKPSTYIQFALSLGQKQEYHLTWPNQWFAKIFLVPYQYAWVHYAYQLFFLAILFLFTYYIIIPKILPKLIPKNQVNILLQLKI